MRELKEAILREGEGIGQEIVKVDGFLNHRIDTALSTSMGQAFYEAFREDGVDCIMTVEASGIAPAIMVGYLLELPVVFAKKKVPSTMENMLATKVYSFTKGRTYDVCVSRDYLCRDDKVLFIDDFLANGNASKGVMDLCEKAGAKIEAMGFIIEKAFQHGGDFLRKEGIRYEALATVESLDDCKIVLK